MGKRTEGDRGEEREVDSSTNIATSSSSSTANSTSTAASSSATDRSSSSSSVSPVTPTKSSPSDDSHTVKVSMARMIEQATIKACCSSYSLTTAGQPATADSPSITGTPEDHPEAGGVGAGPAEQGAPPEAGRQRAQLGGRESRAWKASGEARQASRALSPKATDVSITAAEPASPPSSSSSAPTAANVAATSTQSVAATSTLSLATAASSPSTVAAGARSTTATNSTAAAASAPTTPVKVSPSVALSTSPVASALPPSAVASSTPHPRHKTASNSSSSSSSSSYNSPGASDSERRPLSMEETEEFVKPIIKDGEVILEVECGQNKGLMYLSKLCQGSKGPCIYFQNNWLTPNEYQYVSGRETAKDWKRSIRHHGKSLKLLLSKGILTVHPTVCDCEGCRSGSTLNRNRNGKEKKPPSDKTKLKRQMAALEHHVNGAFKPVGFPATMLVPDSTDAKPRLPADVSPKRAPERHCSPLRESKITNVIEEPRSPKRAVESEPDDVKVKHVASSDTENAASSPVKREVVLPEEAKADAKVQPVTSKVEKSADRPSHENLKKQPSPAKAECARVNGDFRPKVSDHGSQEAKSEARAEKRKASSDSTEERTRDDRVAGSSAPHGDSGQKKSSESEGSSRTHPCHKSASRDSETARQTSEDSSKARQASREKEREKERERDREKEREKEKEREREKEKQREREKAAAKSLASVDPQAASEVPAMLAPESEAACGDYLRYLAAATAGRTPYLSQSALESFYALRSPDVPAVAPAMMPSLHPCAGFAGYTSLLGKESLYPTSAAAVHSMPMAQYISPMHMYAPTRIPYPLSNPLMDQYRPLSYLPLTTTALPYSCPTGMSGLKRVHPDGTDALDLSTKRMRLEYGSPDYRYDAALTAAMYGVPTAYDYAKYANAAALSGAKPSFAEEMARSSPSKEPPRPMSWQEAYAQASKAPLGLSSAFPDFRADVQTWSVEDVCRFVSRLEGCSAYAENFREQKVDGKILPLLTTETLMKNLGLTLGPAVLVSQAVSQKVQEYHKILTEPSSKLLASVGDYA